MDERLLGHVCNWGRLMSHLKHTYLRCHGDEEGGGEGGEEGGGEGGDEDGGEGGGEGSDDSDAGDDDCGGDEDGDDNHDSYYLLSISCASDWGLC